jgi:photosystem II stability/assembly factor-like uncharacterized protein
MKILFVVLSSLFLLSFHTSSQWNLTNGPGTLNIWVLKNLNSVIYAGTQSGAYVTTNNGDSWQQVNSGLPANPNVKDFSADSTRVYCAVFPERKLYFTTNNGAFWSPTAIYPSVSYTQAVTALNGYVFAGCDEYVYSSTANGNTWTAMNTGTYARNITSMITNGNIIYAATSTYGLFFSFLNGNTWTQIGNGLGTTVINELAYGNGTLYAASNKGLQATTNNGSNWIQLNNPLSNTQIQALSLLNTNIFISAQNKVFFSGNNGGSWQDITAGLPSSPNVLSLAYNDTYVFAGLAAGAVYRLLLSSLIGIEPISSNIPSEFSLKQNYPNPFNPETSIRFDIKKAGLVKLSINDISGRHVVSLINSNLKAGEYDVSWNAAGEPSGVYFCRLETTGYSETIKVVLVK